MSWSRLLVLLIVVALAIPAIAPASVGAASLKDQIAAAKERQAALSESIAKSERLVAQLKSEEAQTERDLQQTEEDLKDIRADQVAVKARITEVQERLDRIEARHAELVDEQRQTDFTLGLLEQELANGETDLAARRQALGLRLAEAYRSENTPLLQQLFTADSFSDVLTDTSAYLSYGEQDKQLALQIAQDQQALDSLRLLTTSTRLRTDQLRRETLDTQAKVVELREQLREAKQRLAQLEARTEKARERQKAAIARIAVNKKQAMAMVQKQQAARNQLMRSIQNKVAAMQARASAQFGGVAPTGAAGRFDWPTRGSIIAGLRLHRLLHQPAAWLLFPLPRRHRHRQRHWHAHLLGCQWRGRLHRLEPVRVQPGLHRGHRPRRRHLHALRAHAGDLPGGRGPVGPQGPAHREHGQHRRQLRHAPALRGLGRRRLVSGQPLRLPALAVLQHPDVAAVAGDPQRVRGVVMRDADGVVAQVDRLQQLQVAGAQLHQRAGVVVDDIQGAAVLG